MAGEWVETTLGDVIELKRGYDLPASQRETGTVPIVSSSGISGVHSTAKVRGPGVVTGRYGTIGQVHYIQGDFWPLNTTLYVRDFKGSDPRFVGYALSTLDFWAYSDKAAVPGVNRNDLHLAPVAWPPLAEQRAISKLLGTLDDKIALNRDIADTLETMAGALFKSWFIDFDPVRAKIEGRPTGLAESDAGLFPDRLGEGGVPETWTVGPLDEQFDLLGGGTPKTSVPEYWGGDIPWFSVADIPEGAATFVIETARSITADGLANSAASLLPAGVTIITARGTVGKIALAGTPLTINQSCYAAKSRENRAPYYTYFLIKSAIDRIKSNTHGSVFDTITRQTFSTTMAPVPSDRAIEKYEEIVTPLLNRLRLTVEDSQALGALREVLLPRLVKGDLRILDTDSLDAVA